MLSKRKTIGDYNIGKTIGQGAFSKVKIAYNRYTKEEVAIKIINKKQLEVKNKKTQENKEIYQRKREQEELRKKKAQEKAANRTSAPKIENTGPNINYNNKNEVKNRYQQIPSSNTQNKSQDGNTSDNTNTTIDKNDQNNCESTNTYNTAPSHSENSIDHRKYGHNPPMIPEEEEMDEHLNRNQVDNFSPKKVNSKIDEAKKEVESNDAPTSSNITDDKKIVNEPEEIMGSLEDDMNGNENEKIEKGNSDANANSHLNHISNRKFSVDSNSKSDNHSKQGLDRKFSLDSNTRNHQVNDTENVCTPLQNLESQSTSETSSKDTNSAKDNSIFLKDHSLIPLPSYYERLQNEVQLMMRLDHPNIIKIYQVIESEEETLIVMEYAPGGELIDYILTKKHLNETEARKFFRQIISAIDHCHMANVVHRDLKLENLLLSKDKNILITDFGLGRTFDGSTKDYMTTFCGTPNYAAVELISGIPYIGVKSDIWALGVILYVMMTGKPPFDGKSINALYRRIKRIDYKIPSYFSKDLSNLLAKIFVRDPELRASINDLRDDPWVNYEEVEKPLRIFPINAQEMQQIVSGITNGNGYVSYIFREPSNSSKKRESNLNLSIALSQNNINDCQLISNERRKSNVIDDIIKRRANNSSNPRSPISPDNTKPPFRNMGGIEIPNMDIWGGVVVDQAFSKKLRNKVYSSVMESSGSGGLGSSSLNNNMKHEENYHSVSDISHSSSHSSSRSAANRHCLRLNTNVSNVPNVINSASVDERPSLNPRYYSIVNISSTNNAIGTTSMGSDDSTTSIPDACKVDGVAPLKSYSKSVSQINDESLYTNSKLSNKSELGKIKNGSKQQLKRSSSYGLSNILGKKKNSISNTSNLNRINVPGAEGNTNSSGISPLNPYRISLIENPHKRASSVYSISINTNVHNNTDENLPSPLKKESRRFSKSVSGSPITPKSGSPTEIFSDAFESNNDMLSPEDGIPDYQEIEMWHLIHKPSKTVRSTRLSFNKSTASSKPPFTLFQNLCWALYELRNVYSNRFYFVRNPDYYLFECSLLNKELNDVEVKFEVEVCKVWLLKLYALRLKRISGNPFTYEELYSELISLIKSDEEVINQSIQREFKETVEPTQS